MRVELAAPSPPVLALSFQLPGNRELPQRRSRSVAMRLPGAYPRESRSLPVLSLSLQLPENEELPRSKGLPGNKELTSFM